LTTTQEPGASVPSTGDHQPPADLIGVLERIVIGGVAITTRALADATPGLDLTFPQWRSLLVIGEDPPGITISQVAARVGVTVPATSRQLRRLARRGLVGIEHDPEDRRALRVSLTREGTRVRNAILAYRALRIARLARPFRPSEEAMVLLAGLADAFEGAQ
jgi:DNA-binding MarR family transcriptional regulator